MRTRMHPSTRRGSIVPLLAMTVTLLLAFVALAIDVGVLTIARSEAQNGCDSAALAGARVLNNRPTASANDKTAATNHATGIATSNINVFTQANKKYTVADNMTPAADAVKIGTYTYNTTTQRFDVAFPTALPANTSWTVCQVKLKGSNPTFFAKVVGINTMPWETYATAVHRPRDIAFVVDFSGSMGYGSSLNWPNGGTIEGLMNPDTAYPKFGHYARYTYYQNTSPANANSGTPTARPNPFQMKGFEGNYAPNNHTMETGGGPPIIEDFLTVAGDPTSVNASTAFTNAFKMWNPTMVSAANTTTLTPAVYSYGSYNAATAACPAPDNFDTQSDSPVLYVGDKWPRTDGSRGAQGTNWSDLAGSTYTDRAAYTLKQFLNGTLTGAAGRDLTNFTRAGGGSATALIPGGKDGSNADASYVDAIWERYGYDLNVVDWRSQTGTSRTVNLLPTAQRFKGYSMGPGYWGKTMFVWPPDPRYGADSNTYGAVTGGSINPASVSTTDTAKDSNGNWIADWRRRFFLRGDGQPFNPQVDNINTILFRNTAGHTLNDVTTTVGGGGVSGTPGYYRINYAAIMAWIKSGPRTLPTNLRSGRILYYSSMPDDLTESAAGNTTDKRFWRQYVHYVLGVGQFDSTAAPITNWSYNAPNMIAGVESRNTFGALSRTNATQFTPTGAMSANRKPYMAYTDNVNRPRGHFWFGPFTMLNFIERAGEDRPWWSGTTHEAQCWQVKAAMNSVLDDVRNNHPNDNVGMAFFATRNHFSRPMAPMGQDWFTLKNVLFFRKDTVAALAANANATTEHRPYSSTLGTDTAQIPNGSGATDPVSGMAVAFNLLSSSTSLPSADYGNRGRRGAGKVVVFETDGIPNTTWNWSLTGSGVDTRYQNSGTSEAWTGDASLNTPGRNAVSIVQRMVAPVATSGFSGYGSTTKVYAVAFGDLFQGYTGTNYSSLNTTAQGALRFCLRVQQVGNTSGPGDPPSTMIPFEHVITGSYQRPNPSLPEDPVSNPPGRIEKMRLAYERIMQSGVQVTLVQ